MNHAYSVGAQVVAVLRISGHCFLTFDHKKEHIIAEPGDIGVIVRLDDSLGVYVCFLRTGQMVGVGEDEIAPYFRTVDPRLGLIPGLRTIH